MRKGLVLTLMVVAMAAAAAGAYYRYGRNAEEVKVSTLPVDRGDIAETVGATGTLEAVTTVQVGTQVSGTIKALYADFNSIVRKGQVVAELDPSLFLTQIEQGRANFVRAQAEVERFDVTVKDAATKLERAKGLAARNLIPAIELEAAEVQLRASEAQLKSAEAQVVQAQASLNQSEVNLQHTVITAPIDGIVISRNVDVGQTVAASMQAPTLFVIAADLTKMQVVADIDESDVGRIRPNQRVTFRVDAYASEEFDGTVTQVRLQPKVVQNVVTYATVIDVPNPQLKLKPGMTATVSIEIARKDDVIRVPNAALRFRASPDMFAALSLPVPADPQRGAGATAGAPGANRDAATTSQGTGRGAETRPPEGASVASNAQPRPSTRQRAAGGAAPERVDAAARPAVEARRADASGQQAAGDAGSRGQASERGPGSDSEERRRRLRERMEGVSPAEREQFAARMKQRGMAAPQTIDSLFGPLPQTESRGRVWLYANNQLKPVRLRLGISDGIYTELLGGELQPGMEVVSSIVLPAQAASGQTGRSPLMGPTRGPGSGRPPGR